VESHNFEDIASYVEQRLSLCIPTETAVWQNLKDRILQKSAGIFLWTVLVLDDLLEKWEEGNGSQFLFKRLDVVPSTLEALFLQMFGNLDDAARSSTVKLFQWAIFSIRPLRLHEWHHVLALIRESPLTSLRRWRSSDNFIESDDNLERQIKSISEGLIEVKTMTEERDNKGYDTLSVSARAGSLDLGHGDSRTVQVIHESVRDFFLRNGGFHHLEPELAIDPVGKGHLSIAMMCLDYLGIGELDALIKARRTDSWKDNESHARWASKGSSIHRNDTNPDMTLSREFTLGTRASNPLATSLESHRRGEVRRNHAHESEGAFRGHVSPILRNDIPWAAVKTEQTSVFEQLKSLSGPAARIDIPSWQAAGQVFSEQIYRDAPRRASEEHSVTNESRVLEDYPALLSYSTFMAFTHLAHAAQMGVDVYQKISQIPEVTWNRFLALREDIPRATDIQTYAVSQGLLGIVGPDHNEQTVEPASVERADSRKSFGLFYVAQTQNGRKKPTRIPRLVQQRSIESFHSAGSYGDEKQNGRKKATNPRRLVRQRSIASFHSAGSYGDENKVTTGFSERVDWTAKYWRRFQSESPISYGDEPGDEPLDDSDDWEDEPEPVELGNIDKASCLLLSRPSLVTTVIPEKNRPKR
jgi:hypothetical protein